MISFIQHFGEAENTLPKIVQKGIPIAFDYADRLDHPLVEETLPYVTYGFYSYHEGRDAKIEEFLKDKVSRGWLLLSHSVKMGLAWDGERFYVGGIERRSSQYSWNWKIVSLQDFFMEY